MKVNGSIPRMAGVDRGDKIVLRVVSRTADIVLLSQCGAELPNAEVAVVWVSGECSRPKDAACDRSFGRGYAGIRSLLTVEFEDGSTFTGFCTLENAIYMIFKPT